MSIQYEKSARIRLSIVAFAFFMATMLIQTDDSSVGTIVAFLCLSSMILFALVENGGNLRISRISVSLLLFLLLVCVVTIAKTTQSFRLPRLILQVIACLFMLTIEKVNRREEVFLIGVYIISTTVYSALLPFSILSPGAKTHGNILFLGTSFDPNFIGLPFAFASALELYFLINRKHRPLVFLGLLISYFASAFIVILSASRGSAFSFVLSNLTVLFLYLTRKNKSALKKAFVLTVVLIAGALMVFFFQEKFSNAFARIITIGQRGSDNGRFELWQKGFDTWKENWLFGGGFFANYQRFGRAVHNTYIEVLSETGILGVALLCPNVFRAVKKCLLINRYMFGALVALLIQIVFLDALDNRVLWVVFCWTAVLPEQKDAKEQAVVADYP